MQNKKKLRELENRRIELSKRIQFCLEYKKKVINITKELDNQYAAELISYEKYQNRLNDILKNKTTEEWISYYDTCIRSYKENLGDCEKEIKKLNESKGILPVIMVLIAIIGLGLILSLLKPNITGFAVLDNATNGSLIDNTTIINLQNVTDNSTIVVPEINVTNNSIDRWYGAEKNNLEQIDLISNTKSLILESTLLTDKKKFVYSNPIYLDNNTHIITLYYKLVQVNDSIGEMAIDYYNQTDLVGSSVVEFNESSAWMNYGYKVNMSVENSKGWSKLDIRLDNQENIDKIRLGISFNMGLDYSPQFYIVNNVEVT